MKTRHLIFPALDRSQDRSAFTMSRLAMLIILIAIGLAVPSALSAKAAVPSVVTGTPISSLHGKARQILPTGQVASPGTVAASPVTSTFSFSNSNITTFNSKLTFLSAYEFELYSTYLADKLCDSRSVAATVFSQNSIWSQGSLGGLPYFYKNSLGCFKTQSYGTYIFESKSPVQYVYIALWAGNNNGHSSIAYSLKHYNPYY
jgi:hypothetical protein